jgi:GrpB-like predicted nucleotidyltransferase (UPF0157 family)
MSKSLAEMTDAERAQLFPIILSEYKPVWEKNYLKERSVVEQAIGSHNIVRINHIGSTAIPGCISKPSVDILVEIKDDVDTAKLISNMQLRKYIYLEQQKNPPPHMMFIKGYTPEGFKGQVFHVHVRYGGNWDELYFRDYLLSHPEIADEYGRLKQSLKPRFEYDRDGYTDAKTEFIKRIVALARVKALK